MKTNQVSVNVRMDKKMQYINTIKYLAWNKKKLLPFVTWVDLEDFMLSE